MIVNCVVYQNGRKLAAISVDDISSLSGVVTVLSRVVLKDAYDAELRTMQREIVLHPLAVEDAQHSHRRIQWPLNDGDLKIAEVAMLVLKY